MKRIGIIGCGWLGTKIGRFFSSDYMVLATTRSPEKAELLQKEGFATEIADFYSDTAHSVQFNKADIIIIAANYPKENALLWLENVAAFIGEDFKGQLFLCSSTGIYPDVEKEFTEEDTEGLDVSIAQMEAFFKKRFTQLNTLRLGGLMGDERYLSKWFVNRSLPKPGARINYIHYTDILGVIQVLVNSKTNGKTYNVIAPLHPRKSEVFFAQTGKLVEGEEYNRIVSCNKLIKETGYTFVYPDPVKFPFLK